MSRRHVARAAGALLCATGAVALSAPAAQAAYTDYRCAELSGVGDKQLSFLVVVTVPPSPVLGINCRPTTGDGMDQILVYGGRNGHPGFRCTSYNALIRQKGLNSGVFAGCTLVLSSAIPEPTGGGPASEGDNPPEGRKAKAKAQQGEGQARAGAVARHSGRGPRGASYARALGPRAGRRRNAGGCGLGSGAGLRVQPGHRDARLEPRRGPPW